MGYIRCMNATASDIKYLYKDGVQVVPWDNSTALRPNTAWSNGVHWTLTQNCMKGTYNTSSSLTATGIVTDSMIDFTDYSTLHVNINGVEYSYDISSCTQHYLLFAVMGTEKTFRIVLSLQKTPWEGAAFRNFTSTGTFYTTSVVTRVWLQK